MRVAQEALTNVRRHAAGAPVRAALTFAPRETVLTVHDAAAPARDAGARRATASSACASAPSCSAASCGPAAHPTAGRSS